MLNFPFILLILIVLVFITRPFTVLFHELGHAITALLLTRQKVTIYIGSYGDPTKSLKLHLGLLVIFFHYNPLTWLLGLCVPSAKAVSINKKIVFTIAGPVASILVGGIACHLAFANDLHGALKMLSIVFIGAAILDLIANLVPNPSPIVLYDGTVTYNDGYTLAQLFDLKRMPKEYSEAANLFVEKRFSESAAMFEKMLLNKTKDKNIFRLAVSAYFQNMDFQKAIELSESYASAVKLNSEDFSNIALSYSMLGYHEKAITLYDESLRLMPYNKYSLNNKGYTLNLMHRFEEAIPIFDKLIDFDKNFAYAYNNRGHARIKIGATEEGLKDINFSLELDPANSYGYLNLGIYNLDICKYKKALHLFEKAKEFDKSTYMVDELIKEATSKLNLSLSPMQDCED